MPENKPTYSPEAGWRYATEHSMHRRMEEHDYKGRSIYMITMEVKNRQPLLGVLKVENAPQMLALIELTPLGRMVEQCWQSISTYYPEVEVLELQIMPDHIHGLLFIHDKMKAHLGQIIKGFKAGCTKALRELLTQEGDTSPQSSVVPSVRSGSASNDSLASASLFSAGYQDSVLKGKGQLQNMIRYIKDNPRRLAVKRMNPELFQVVRNIEIDCGAAGRFTFAAIGNRWLLDYPVKMQVRCHRSTSPENLQLIARQKAYFLERGAQGGVVVSPCISPGEKEIARAALNARQPLIVILENGFPPMYKPPGRYFEACANGLLLMLAPWPYHMEKRSITRQQCLTLNSIAYALSTEPWTDQLEAALSR